MGLLKLKQAIIRCEEMRNILLCGDPGTIEDSLKELGVDQKDTDMAMKAAKELRKFLEELSREMPGI